MSTIREKILTGMRMKNMRAADLARAADVSKTTVSNLIHEKRKKGDPMSLRKVAEALGIDPKEFLMDVDILPKTKAERRDAELNQLENIWNQLSKDNRHKLTAIAHALLPTDTHPRRNALYEQETR